SNKHCKITASVDGASKEYLVICEDLSSNGTFWNGKKIGKGKSVMLSHGDVIEIKKGHYFTYLQLTQKHDSNKDGDQVDGKYQVTETVLGKGTFAEIRLVHRKDTQQQLAVKIMEKRNFSLRGTAEGGANYIHEINLLRGIKHPNIVRVFDVSETSRHVYIFMPLLRGGDLFDYILDHERLDEDEARFIIYQVLLALKYLHDANIAHRDLKPENTLLVSKKPYSQVMLTDFGMAKATGQQALMKTMCGTLQYIAPEMISSGVRPGQALKVGYSKAVDCWSLGVMTYAMVSGMLPFTDDEANPQTLFSQILSGHIDFSYPCWRAISFECQSFIYSFLRINPDKRMTVDKAFTHPWI
ncbi:Pkinase-domain-containing protein, partial [Martensiomyces pterosporus]